MRTTQSLLVTGLFLFAIVLPRGAFAQADSPEDPAAQAAPAQQQAEPAQVVTGLEQDGELKAVDTDNMFFLVLGEDGNEMLFHYDAGTEVVGETGGIQGLTGQGGTSLHIWYRAEGETAIAEKIELGNSAAPAADAAPADNAAPAPQEPEQ